jgi:hypothetical protein
MEALTDAQFAERLQAARDELEAAYADATTRPSSIRLSNEETLKNAMGRTLSFSDRVKAWGAANPEKAKRIADASTALDTLKPEEERRRKKAEDRKWALSTLDDVPRIRDLVAMGLDDTKAWDAMREWGRAPSWCLLLLGGVGSGKSTAAGAYAVNWATDYRRRPLWVRAVEASRMSGFGADAEARFGVWREASLLVVDDLGTELMTPTWQQALDDVMDFRYQHSLRTILPSNLTADEFKKRYGERISDRIRHEGTVRVIDTKSMRRGGK